MIDSTMKSGSNEPIPKGTMVFLAGPPLSGKSAVGATMATLLGVPFSDLDSLVELSAGTSIGQLFRDRGESAFRELETATLRDAASGELSMVLALGGGTLLDAANLDLVLSRGVLVTLWAEPAALQARMTPDASARPLSHDPRSLLRLLESREAHYRSLPNRIDTTGMTVMEVAQEAALLVRDHPR